MDITDRWRHNKIQMEYNGATTLNAETYEIIKNRKSYDELN